MEFLRMFTLRHIASVALPLLMLLFVRFGDAPSLADRAQAKIRSMWDGSAEHTKQLRSKFRSRDRTADQDRNQVEQRMQDFFRRHPSLEPAWRDVPADKNGYLLLQEFVEGDLPPDFSVDESIKKMMTGEVAWDAEAVSAYLHKHSGLLAKLRHIGSMKDRSTKGVPRHQLDFFAGRPYIQAADLLALSLAHHLRNNNVEAALVDFSTARGIASHLDQHEVPTLQAKGIGMVMRFIVNRQLLSGLDRFPADMDYTPWIRLLADEPPFGPEMARVYRRDALSIISSANRNKFEVAGLTAFEDAVAHQTVTVSTFLERDGKMPAQEMWEAQEADWQAFGPDAYLFLTSTLNGKWHAGAMSGHTRSIMALAALEILKVERAGGPITSADDPRLAGITNDPSTGKPFVFDPSTRELSPDANSALTQKDEKHVVRLPKR